MKRRLAALGLAFALGGCDGDRSLAVLSEDDPGSLAALKAALSRAMGGGEVTLGAGDPTQNPTVAVVPRLARELDRNAATPILFRIATAGGKCYVVRQDTRAATEIVGAACRPVSG